MARKARGETIHFWMKREIREQIAEYRMAHTQKGKIPSESRAVRDLVEIGLQWWYAHRDKH